MTVMRWRQLLLLAIASMCVVTLVMGIATHGLYVYDRRNLVPPFCAAVIAGIGYAQAARFGPRGPVVLALVAAAILFGPGPAAVLVLTLVVALAAGLWVTRLLWLPNPVDPFLATVTGLAVMVGVLQVAVQFRINWATTYLLAALATIIPARRVLMDSVRSWWVALPRPRSRAETVAAAMCFGALVAASTYGGQPEAGYDALSTHFLVAGWVSWNGYFHFDPALVWRALMPRGAVWLFTWSHILGGELAMRLLNVSAFWLSVGMVARQASLSPQRDDAPPALTLLGLFALAVTPMTVFLVGTTFEETVTAMFVTGSLICLARAWQCPEEAGWTYLAFLLLGAACASKMQSLFFGGIGIALLVNLIRGQGWRDGLRRGLAGVVLFAVVGLTPYVRAWLISGNPFFPYQIGVPFDQAYVGRFTADLLYRMVFETETYLDSLNGSFGFQHLVLLPVVLIAGLVARRVEQRILACVLALFIIALLSQAQYARYQFYALPGVLLLLPVAWTAMDRAGRAVLIASLCGGALLNVLAYRSVVVPPFRIEQLVQRQRYAVGVPEERNIVAVLNALDGKAARPYFAGPPFVAELLGEPTLVYSDVRAAIDRAQTADDVERILRAAGITHVVTATDASEYRLLYPIPPLLRQVLTERMQEIPSSLKKVRLYVFPRKII